MSLRGQLLNAIAAAVVLVGGANRLVAAETDPPAAGVAPPRLSPDYAGIVLPPNIAPLNFRVLEPGVGYRVELRSRNGDPIVVTSRDSTIILPLKPWRALLEGNVGQPLWIEVSVQDAQGGWRRFGTVTNQIAREAIDSHLAYRLLKPLYNFYANIGVYQRDLESFEEKPILQNQQFGNGCLNCHTFLQGRPDHFALNIRGAGTTNYQPTLVIRSNEIARLDKTLGYLAWHPSGRLLAFSANKLSLLFHTTGETRDVFDANSNLGIYRLDSNRVVNPAPISRPDRNETWPAWSPDGRYLYFSSAPVLPIERFRQVRYDLMRVSYDLERDQWGEPETLIVASNVLASACQPKVSPDGRFVLFCLSPYGNFPIYQPGSDLFVMDAASRAYRRLEINSDRADSWHCWSSNGRWIVFSSKRLDGLFARPFFSYVDEQGRFHKPFVLPQANPAHYESYLNTYNVPELVRGPVKVTQHELARAIRKPTVELVPPTDAKAAAQTTPHADEVQGYRRNAQ